MLTHPDIRIRVLQGCALLITLGIPGVAIGYYQYRKSRLLSLHRLDGGFAAQVWASIGCLVAGLLGVLIFGILALIGH